MPHIPRSLSQTSGIRPEVLNAPGQPKGDRPAGQVPKQDEKDAPQTQLTMVPSLSLRRFEMPVSKIVQNLFGVRVEQDEYTKELRRV